MFCFFIYWLLSKKWLRTCGNKCFLHYSRNSISARPLTAMLFNCKSDRCNNFAVIAPLSVKTMSNRLTACTEMHFRMHFNCIKRQLTDQLTSEMHCSYRTAFDRCNVNMLHLSNVECTIQREILNKKCIEAAVC